MVNLPAESCACGYNFRTGQNPKAAPLDLNIETRSKTPFVVAGVVALLAIILLIVFLSGGQPQPIPTPPQAKGSGLAPPPALSDSPLLKPHVPIGQAQGVANRANDNVQRLRDTQAEIDSERAR
jgi:hypothetical protein